MKKGFKRTMINIEKNIEENMENDMWEKFIKSNSCEDFANYILSSDHLKKSQIRSFDIDLYDSGTVSLDSKKSDPYKKYKKDKQLRLKEKYKNRTTP